MLIILWGVAVLGSTWIIAWHISTQAAIAGAAVMTFAVLGVLAVYSILRMTEDRPGRTDR